ncbi:GNAT family N-acetyltransferase [Roseomonas terrae]|uniref:GNAT family N-acetyltransferase n=1 Tax=Neoroseomonas terrae TaxID=424799 RepID=A0ABS5EPA6_9PROT|nr:GNAT family N-acetyltransferase [Neoroseomonas terrae]
MIRPGCIEDAGQLAALFNAINSLDGNPLPVTMTATHVEQHLLGPSPWSLLRVAEIDGVVAGFITASPAYDSARAAGCYIVIDLYVHPDFRRRGVARALMAAMAAEGRRNGAGCLWWGVDDGDDEATAFYISLGATVEDHFEGRILVGAAYDTLAAEAEP